MDERLVGFIKKHIEIGYDAERIKQALLNAGHDIAAVEGHISHVLSSINLEKFIKRHIELGTDIDKIRQYLSNGGYDINLIEQHITKSIKKRKNKRYAFIATTLLVIIIFSAALYLFKNYSSREGADSKELQSLQAGNQLPATEQQAQGIAQASPAVSCTCDIIPAICDSATCICDPLCPPQSQQQTLQQNNITSAQYPSNQSAQSQAQQIAVQQPLRQINNTPPAQQLATPATAAPPASHPATAPAQQQTTSQSTITMCTCDLSPNICDTPGCTCDSFCSSQTVTQPNATSTPPPVAPSPTTQPQPNASTSQPSSTTQTQQNSTQPLVSCTCDIIPAICDFPGCTCDQMCL